MTRTYLRFDFWTERRPPFLPSARLGSYELAARSCDCPHRHRGGVHRRDWNCANGLVRLATDAPPHTHQVGLTLLGKMMNRERFLPLYLAGKLCEDQSSGICRQVFKLGHDWPSRSAPRQRAQVTFQNRAPILVRIGFFLVN